ncbi:TfoX/Sxy family DNA transformation protein [Dinoroseobacter sp. S76]|uniref:TfoX/Sxy family DNA transformation protein n=1 Tax=Dinoroseobacter sp. S76 TaxID=3415124 RepID=UPI003C7AB6F4
MPEPLTSVRNIGPAMADALSGVGITDAEMLHDLGPDAAYLRLLNGGSRPHFIAYYALVMGMQGRPWNDAKGKEKDALRVRFDGLKALCQPEVIPGIERILDEIGVRPARSG